MTDTVGTPAAERGEALTSIDLDVQGMTCASCVRRVERKLGKLDGVSAEVNLATESARITLTAPHSDEELEAVVSAAGYSGTVTSRSEAATTDGAPAAGGSAGGDTGTPTQTGTTPGTAGRRRRGDRPGQRQREEAAVTKEGHGPGDTHPRND